jgi:hypothetical protein
VLKNQFHLVNTCPVIPCAKGHTAVHEPEPAHSPTPLPIFTFGGHGTSEPNTDGGSQCCDGFFVFLENGRVEVIPSRRHVRAERRRWLGPWCKLSTPPWPPHFTATESWFVDAVPNSDTVCNTVPQSKNHEQLDEQM